MTVLNTADKTHRGTADMDKKRLEYYKKKLQTKREELARSIARTEEEGRSADDDPTVDLADKAANSYTRAFAQKNISGAAANDKRASSGAILRSLMESLPVGAALLRRMDWK